MSDLYMETAAEALSRWDEGDSVFSIEMGGLGPGYEQAIHILTFEIVRDNLDRDLPNEPDRSWADDTVHRVNKMLGHWGFSGAQVGAARWLAYQFLRYGPRAVIERHQENDGSDRVIQVQRGFPSELPTD